MRSRIGRPVRYSKIIKALESDTLYTPAKVAQFADEQGLMEDFISEDVDKKKAMLRLRVAMGRTSSKYFPDEGDSIVFIKGQRPTPGWFGWRWQEHYT